MNIQKSKLKMTLATAFLFACFTHPVFGLVLINYSEDTVKGYVKSADKNQKIKMDNFQLRPMEKLELNITGCPGSEDTSLPCLIHVENTGATFRSGKQPFSLRVATSLYGIHQSKKFKDVYDIR